MSLSLLSKWPSVILIINYIDVLIHYNLENQNFHIIIIYIKYAMALRLIIIKGRIDCVINKQTCFQILFTDLELFIYFLTLTKVLNRELTSSLLLVIYKSATYVH